MARRGQHPNDSHHARTGPNNRTQSTTIPAGTPRKPEIYEEQARQQRDTDPEPQHDAARRTRTQHHGPPRRGRCEAPSAR